jgi:hypothetical protein
MGAEGLKRMDFVAVQNQQRLGFAKLDLKTAVPMKLRQVGDSMQGHVQFLIGFY